MLSTHTLVATQNIEKVQDVIWKDLRLCVWAITEMVNLGRESVRHILRDELNMKILCRSDSKIAIDQTKRT